jgi:apolipoprotein N-acyltransferase
MDHFTADNQALISQVPTRGVPTVYAKIGDVFAWLCALGLLALFYVGLRKPVGEGR